MRQIELKFYPKRIASNWLICKNLFRQDRPKKDIVCETLS